MVAQDYMMDLCGSLYAVPITTNYSTYCNSTLGLPDTNPVPDAGYSAYLDRLKAFNEMLDLRRNPYGKHAEVQTINWPKDAIDVSLEQPKQAEPKAPEVQIS